MGIKQFDRLVALSPYPVNISDCGIFSAGCFYWGINGDKRPYQHIDFNPHIEISTLIKSEPARVAVLLHEIGHAMHYRRHCRCYQDGDKYLREYHAERFALRFMLRYKLRGALRYEIKDLEKNLSNYAKWWQKPIKQLQSEKIWSRCKNYLDNTD